MGSMGIFPGRPAGGQVCVWGRGWDRCPSLNNPSQDVISCATPTFSGSVDRHAPIDSRMGQVRRKPYRQRFEGKEKNISVLNRLN